MLVRFTLQTGKNIILGGRLAPASRIASTALHTTPSASKDDNLPDLDYNWWYKIKAKNERAYQWREQFVDLRWQYLQDPKVAKGDIVPIIQKDSAERDTKNWPAPAVNDLPGRTRMLVIPEEFFNFMYSKTGVTGPYLLLWGGLGYIWSQEWLRLDEETALFLELTVLPLFVYQRILLPRMWSFLEKRRKHKDDSLYAFKAAFMAQLEIQNAAEKLNFEMVKSARDYMYKAKKEIYQLQWEAVYRQRLYEAYEKVKKRLDYHAEMNACKNRHENKHMVNWIVDSVVSSITPQQEKAALDKCISDLKALSATAKV